MRDYRNRRDRWMSRRSSRMMPCMPVDDGQHAPEHMSHFPMHFPGMYWTRSRRFIFWRFVMIFGGIALAFLVALAILHYTGDFPRPFQPESPPNRPPFAPVFFLCGIPLAFVLVVSLVAGWAFRRIGTPFADIMSAADTIAKGDLSVRLREDLPGEIGQLGHRFNHMTSELERAEKQRRNLTADIAHELRTPLHIIQGNLEGMLDGVYEPTPENITNTLDETKLLARLVSDLQTLSLAEAGQLPLHPTNFLLADLVNDLVSSFSAQAASLGIDLRADISNPSKKITADYDRLDQSLSNLIANAMRHTPQGGVVSMKTETTPAGVRVVVQDTGEGISAEDIPFIFDRFWRGNKSRTDRTNSGLGLAIARQLIHAHQGTIEVQSELKAGTKFIIELPGD